MADNETENILTTFKSSLEAIFQEKLTKEKWRAKMANFSARINMAAVIGPDQKGYLNVIIDKGKIAVENGKLDNPDIELTAPFEIFFKISSRQANPIKMLLARKLKAKASIKNLGKLLMLEKLMILEMQ